MPESVLEGAGVPDSSGGGMLNDVRAELPAGMSQMFMSARGGGFTVIDKLIGEIVGKRHGIDGMLRAGDWRLPKVVFVVD